MLTLLYLKVLKCCTSARPQHTHSVFNMHEGKICVDCDLRPGFGLFMVPPLPFCLPNAAIKVNINSSDGVHHKYRRK